MRLWVQSPVSHTHTKEKGKKERERKVKELTPPPAS
jgi:hypothetical protein